MKLLILFSAFFITACGTGHYHDYLRQSNIPPPTTNAFIHCYNYGCQTKNIIVLPERTKERLQENFTPAPKDAAQEREKIATAIKIFEEDIGALVGTKNDKRGTFRLYEDDSPESKRFQQDCIDESTNTTIYLGLLKEMTLIKFHTPVFPANRQPFFSGAPWWHQTAVMIEEDSSEKFAVDSWFRDNGYPAFIVPLKEWKAGWMAPKLPQTNKEGAKLAN